MMKKILSSVFALTVAAGLAAVSASAEYAKGDVDNSGKVDIEDAVMMISHINGTTSLSGDMLSAADINCDGNVDIEDVVSEINTVNGVGETALTTYENSVFSLSYSPYWKVYHQGDDIIMMDHYQDLHSVKGYSGSVSVDYDDFTVTSFDDVKRYAEICVDISFINVESDVYSGEYSVTGQKKVKFKGRDAYEYDLVHTYDGEVTDYLRLVFISKGNKIIIFQSNYVPEYASDMKNNIDKVYDSLIIK